MKYTTVVAGTRARERRLQGVEQSMTEAPDMLGVAVPTEEVVGKTMKRAGS